MCFEHFDDRKIEIFFEFTCFNLNYCEGKRAGKGQQTKTEIFEHCEERMFLVSTNART